MAVVQISRIQIRRGRKNQGSGLPQLASGEFGWAVDSQELFIGNGAVSEGAPYVGNTKVLTEHDNLFEYASNYTYRVQDGWIDTGGVERTLQARLDDIVSVRAFGCAGDGTDQTAAFQKAVDQLFLNDASKNNPSSRVILFVEPGIYVFSSTIYIPPYANIVGAGEDKTIFRFNGTGAAFETVNSLSTPGNPASHSITTNSNKSVNIMMKGFSLSVPFDRTAILLENCSNSVFENIELSSFWNFGDIPNNSKAIQLNGLANVTMWLNTFRRVTIRNFGYAVYSDWDIADARFDQFDVTACAYGVVFGKDTVLGLGGQFTGPFNNTIERSKFIDIERQCFWVANGTGNTSINNRYYRSGNDGGNSSNVIYPIIQFDKNGNNSENDWFERSLDLGSSPAYILNVPFVPEVSSNNIIQQSYTQSLNLTEYGEYTKLFKLPADVARGFEIDYVYKSNAVSAVRHGTLNLVVDPTNDDWSISDEYDYVGDGAYAESLTFQAQTYDENSDTVVDTVAVMVLNSTSSDDAEFYYRVKTKA